MICWRQQISALSWRVSTHQEKEYFVVKSLIFEAFKWALINLNLSDILSTIFSVSG